jgi:hypothetical protein
MSVATGPVQLSEPMVSAASQQAARSGVTLDEWVAEAVAFHLSETEATQEFFRQRAAGARKGALGEALRAIPDREPDPEDQF